MTLARFRNLLERVRCLWHGHGPFARGTDASGHRGKWCLACNVFVRVER